MADTSVDSVNNNKAIFLEAMKISCGVVTTASESCGLSRAAHYKWMNNDEAYAKAIEDLEDETLDMVESALYTQIKSGSVAATTFYLKSKGRKRGFADKLELTGKDGGALQINAIFSEDLLKTED